ncbi:sigma-70 family RNA polymerase sigma factor [Ruminococcus sp. CLA-AA-H200]|uniref:Sigma-70 family RNA polymerase sigma factor n=2 Tax=Ruminococcus turbiniformis TaxID=2881258 RepID=A0ABS8G0K8_9FIRM|nr:sigma-70 family RNA polymerase sigma factor [Ruminococcus turbiniformis]
MKERWELMDDSKIVQLYWDRNEQALTATSDKYGNYCITIAKNILGNKEDAEECVNDTYMRAWNSLPPHRPNILSTYLGKITRNLSFNLYKRNTADKRGGGEVPVVLDEIVDLVSDTDDVEKEIDRRELVKAIDDFLGKLPADKRSIFICRYWYFDSISNIASRFGMTNNYVSVLLNRLRLKLHNYLLERGFEI